MKKILILSVLLQALTLSAFAQDWAELARYQEANQALLAGEEDPSRVVFMGNSIFDRWESTCPEFFAGSYVCRGISGQTTPQMLIRFKQDVVHLNPSVVVILGGTNDIAGNTGPSTLEMIEDNLSSMAEIATANGIKVVMCQLLPAYSYGWAPDVDPRQDIIDLNQWIKEYADAHGYPCVDFYTPMVNPFKALKVEYSVGDGVHPNEAGYAVMAPLVEAAIEQAMAGSSIATQTADDPDIEVWGGKSVIHVKTQAADHLSIYTPDGVCVAEYDLPAGISNLNMAPGTYLVKSLKSTRKIQVR